MELMETKIEGVFIIKFNIFEDNRGKFIKIYNEDLFSEKGLTSIYKEQFITISRKDVIRAMHFQTPPYAHDKLVYVAYGSIMDVILDMRKNSKTFGNYINFELNDDNRYGVYIPIGCAHGYKVLTDKSVTVYNTSTVFNASSDDGILWNSFGFDWGIDNPILSEKDKHLSTFIDCINLF